jgi:hypothetical protein
MFTAQGAALNKVASRNVKVLVVGNSANTNACIAMKSAPDLPAETFTAMLRLDHSRIPEGIIYGVPVSPKTAATPASPAWKWMIAPRAAMGKRSRAEPTIHHNTGMPKRRTSVSSSWRRNGNDGAMNRWSCIRDGS